MGQCYQEKATSINKFHHAISYAYFNWIRVDIKLRNSEASSTSSNQKAIWDAHKT